MDWDNPTHALARREPRRGRRAALAATVHMPAGPLLVYNLHLEGDIYLIHMRVICKACRGHCPSLRLLSAC